MLIIIQRSMADEDKLKVYIRIVRLLLEEEDSVQAETYYNRAASLVNATKDRETLLSFKLCQARINDYTRKFLEAASKYHELSWTGEIDEDERTFMLYAFHFHTPFWDVRLITLTDQQQLHAQS